MLESSSSCLNPGYSHIVHSPERITSLAHQLNYITDIVLELKTELAKIKTKVKEIKKQLVVTHLSLTIEIRYSEKSDSSLSTPFQHKYHFQNPKIKNPFSVQDLKTQKEVEKSPEKSSRKELEKGDGL